MSAHDSPDSSVSRAFSRSQDGGRITGPIFGGKMKQPTGAPAEWEGEILREAGLSPEVWDKFPQLTSGTRRAYLIRPEGLIVEEEGPGTICFRFTLPSGAYATTLLREFQKGEEAAPSEK